MYKVDLIPCDWWVCKLFQDCKKRAFFKNEAYPPCGICIRFDACEDCVKLSECSELVGRYTPNMFRRLVRHIRLGLETDDFEAYLRKNTLGGRRKR